MHACCKIAAIALMLAGCAHAAAPPERTPVMETAGTPRHDRVPFLPSATEHLPDDWFAGAYRLDHGPCSLLAEAGPGEGSVSTAECPSPWSRAARWRRLSDERGLVAIDDADGARLWTGMALQLHAIAGVDADGQLVRLYPGEDGPAPVWVFPQPE